MRVEDLSVNERILVHLRDFPTDPTVEDARLGQTQEGIAEAVAIRVNHVPRATKKLKEEGYLDDALVHIGGLKRKRRAYFLTGKGQAMASQLLSRLEECPVSFRDMDGREENMPVRDIVFKVHGVTAPKVILAAYRDGVVVESVLQGRGGESRLSNLGRVPIPAHFVNRAGELEEFNDLIERRSIVLVCGLKGIGKTSLVRGALEERQENFNIFWYTAHTWDTVRGLMDAASEFYVRLGRNEMKRVLRQTGTLDVSAAASAILTDLQDSDSIVVLDSLFGLRPELNNLLALLCERQEELRGCRMVLITRDSEGLIASAYRKNVGEPMFVRGLDRESSMELMDQMGLSQDEMERIFTMTQGHPLAMELVNSQEIEKMIDTEGLTKEEMWVVRCLKAFDAIFEGGEG